MRRQSACLSQIVPLKIDRIWGIWGSYYRIPKAIFYLPKGDYRFEFGREVGAASFLPPAVPSSNGFHMCCLNVHFKDLRNVITRKKEPWLQCRISWIAHREVLLKEERLGLAKAPVSCKEPMSESNKIFK